MVSSEAGLSVITAREPNRSSKSFHLNGGQLIKVSGGNLCFGEVQSVSIPGIAELAQLLDSLSPAQAIVWGQCGHERAWIVTKERLSTTHYDNTVPVIARDRNHFHWHEGPGFLMLDYDPGREDTPLTADELLILLYEICQEIRQAPHLVRPSASSFLYNGESLIHGARGWRVIVLVQDVGDIPRAGEVLFKRAWLAGHGRIEISKAGSLLIRGPVDNACWQPERLDFCGGTHCILPVTQRVPATRIFNPDATPLDTRAALMDLSLSKLAEYERLVGAAKTESHGSRAIFSQVAG